MNFLLQPRYNPKFMRYCEADFLSFNENLRMSFFLVIMGDKRYYVKSYLIYL
jgi:hypothetical protein